MPICQLGHPNFQLDKAPLQYIQFLLTANKFIYLLKNPYATNQLQFQNIKVLSMPHTSYTKLSRNTKVYHFDMVKVGVIIHIRLHEPLGSKRDSNFLILTSYNFCTSTSIQGLGFTRANRCSWQQEESLQTRKVHLFPKFTASNKDLSTNS